jgi:hypothetical protein
MATSRKTLVKWYSCRGQSTVPRCAGRPAGHCILSTLTCTTSLRSSFAPAFLCGCLIQNCWYSLYSYPLSFLLLFLFNPFYPCFSLFLFSLNVKELIGLYYRKNSAASLNFAIAVPTSSSIYLSAIHFTVKVTSWVATIELRIALRHLKITFHGNEMQTVL